MLGFASLFVLVLVIWGSAKRGATHAGPKSTMTRRHRLLTDRVDNVR